MASFMEVGSTEFLRRCRTSQISGNDIIESLGLKNGSVGPAPPRFDDPNVLELYKSIVRQVDDVTEGDEHQLELVKSKLVQEDFLKEFLETLAEKYGDMLWGRKTRKHLLVANETSRYRQFLHWDIERDNIAIRFYLRCWVIKIVSRRIRDKLRKAKTNRRGDLVQNPLRNTITEGVCEFVDISSDEELSKVPSSPRPASPKAGKGSSHFRAPLAPMTPPHTISRAKISTPITNDRYDGSQSGETSRATGNLSPRGTLESALKRKAVPQDDNVCRAKLTKPSSYMKAVSERPRQRQEDTYAVSPSPSNGLFVTPGPTELPRGIRLFGQRRPRSSSIDSDPNWTPPLRDSIESEPQFLGRSPNEASTSLVQSLHHREASSCDKSRPTDAIPSVSTRNSFLRDSKIPEFTHNQDDTTVIQTTEVEVPTREDSVVATPRSATVAPKIFIIEKPAADVTTLRTELFMLLLARLNNLNEFREASTSCTAVERLDYLLSHFWVDDQRHLLAKHGSKFPALKFAYENWMNTRSGIRDFQHSTGFGGTTREEWQAYLKTVNGWSKRAEAVIAYATMCEQIRNFSVHEAFDENLKLVFDELTRFPACNGAEEFGGIVEYNNGLRRWLF